MATVAERLAAEKPAKRGTGGVQKGIPANLQEETVMRGSLSGGGNASGRVNPAPAAPNAGPSSNDGTRITYDVPAGKVVRKQLEDPAVVAARGLEFERAQARRRRSAASGQGLLSSPSNVLGGAGGLALLGA